MEWQISTEQEDTEFVQRIRWRFHIKYRHLSSTSFYLLTDLRGRLFIYLLVSIVHTLHHENWRHIASGWFFCVARGPSRRGSTWILCPFFPLCFNVFVLFTITHFLNTTFEYPFQKLRSRIPLNVFSFPPMNPSISCFCLCFLNKSIF